MKNKFEIEGDKVSVFLNRRDGTILETIIDKEDLAKIQEISGTWYASKNKNCSYATSSTGKVYKRRQLQLHRWIMDTPEGLQVDHINHDTLDNTRSNLRNVTASENMQNLHTKPLSNSGFRGVAWHKGCGKWRALIWLNGTNAHLGLFDDVKQAAQVAHEARIRFMPGYIHS